MADDKNPDSVPESEESTTDPTGAELAGSDLKGPEGDPIEQPDELKASGEIVDPEDLPDDEYVDDPDTPDINEAKLDRATDEVAGDETASAGSVAQRRPRPNRPVRRRRVEPAADPEPGTDLEPAELSDADDLDGEQDQSDDDAGVTRVRPGSARTTAPVRKGHATRTRKEAEAEAHRRPTRTTPVAFVRQSVGELRKVVWPTGTQVQQYFVVVLVFVLFIMTLVSLLDLGFGWVILNVFG